MPNPSTHAVEVSGGSLHVTSWGAGPATVLGIHGITASSLSLAHVARALDGGHRLVAPDLRGRGRSAALPGPYGLRVHAADCAAVVRALARPPVVVLGHSMGASVAVVLAATHPDLVERLVLADGGLPPAPPTPIPPDVDPDALVDAVLGPAMQRLAMEFPSEESYVEFWRAHPAMEEWNDDVEAYVRYDLRPVEGAFRSRVVEAAVRTDGAEQLTQADFLGECLRSVGCPIRFIGAPRGLLNQPEPLVPPDVVATWAAALPDFGAETMDDVNHYTLVTGDRGAARVAARVAAP